MPSMCNYKLILSHRQDNQYRHSTGILESVVEFEVSIFALNLVAVQLACADFEVSEHFDFVSVVSGHFHNGS